MKLWMAAAAIAIPATAMAQEAPPAAQGEPVRRVMARVPPPMPRTGERADLAIELVAGMPTVTAMVNGRGPYRFGIETGYPGNLRITPALAAALGLEQVGEAMGGDPSGRNPRRIPLYRVESVMLGGLTYSGIDAGAMDFASPRMKTLDGLLGLGFLRDLLVTIDYGAGRFTAAPGALPPADGASVVELTVDRGLLSIPIAIGGMSYPVHLDTGNSRHPLFMPAELIAKLPTRGQPRDIGVGRTISQEVALQAVDLAAPVAIGGTRLSVTEVAFPAIAPVGNVGSLALAGMAVTLDLANRRVRVVPSKR